MKKLVTVFAALSMIATPALADGRHGGEYREHRGSGCGWLCGAIIGGVVVGAIASGSKNRDRREDSYSYDERRYEQRRWQYVCQDIVKYDYYGNPYVAGRNCWYQ